MSTSDLIKHRESVGSSLRTLLTMYAKRLPGTWDPSQSSTIRHPATESRRRRATACGRSLPRIAQRTTQ